MRALIACALVVSTVAAQAAENDDFNYVGDKLSFAVNVKGQLGGKGGQAVCVPAKLALRGMRADPSTANSADTFLGLYVHIAKFGAGKAACVDAQDKEMTALPANTLIYIDKSQFDIGQPNRYGLTYGGLIVPFKYHLKGSKEFKGGSTIGPFLGYRFDGNDHGFGVKLVGFLGASTISVEQNIDGTAKTQTLAGFSYGLGAIGTVKGAFQMGVVFGVDRVSRSANYGDNGKVWMAVAIGHSFAN
jgi:hypothetical protein